MLLRCRNHKLPMSGMGHCRLGSNGDRIAASVCCASKNALGTEKGAQAAGQPELIHAVAVRANMRSILVAMMKSFSCNPLIFLVCRETAE